MKLENKCDDLRSNLQKLLQADKYCDIVLISGDGKDRIPAHRVVLAASSPYFEGQISNVDGNTMKEIIIAEINGATLQRLVNVCYSGILEVDEENVSSLYMGAIHLHLSSLLNTMDNYISTLLNNFNCLHFYHLAGAFSRSVLLDATKIYICAHFLEIVDQPAFLELSAIKLKDLLALEGLQVPSAEDLFRNIIKWIQHDRDGKRDDVFSELLPYLRLSSMSQKFLFQHVKPHCKTAEAKGFYLAALEAQIESVPSITTDVKRLPVPVDVGREKLVVVVGCSNGKCEIIEYSFERQYWITLGELPTIVFSFFVTYSKALNSLCFVGQNMVSPDVLLWNLKTRISTYSTKMKEARCSAGVCSLNDGSDEDGDLIVVGGFNSDSKHLSTVERWSRKSGSWHSLLPITEAKCKARLVPIGNHIYCIGGYNGRYLNSVNCFNLTEKSRSNLAPLNHGRSNFGTFVDGGKIYVIGGYSDVIESYDPETNKWTEVCTVEGSKNVVTCVRHNNRLFAFGAGIVLTSDGDLKVWKKSDTIEAMNNTIYGAFSIPEILFN